MTAQAQYDGQPLSFTDQAASMVYELIQEEDPDLKLRVFVTGGGCSGFQYGFEFVEQPGEIDFVIEKTVQSAAVQSMAESRLVSESNGDSSSDAEDDEGDSSSGAEDDEDSQYLARVQFLVDPVSLQYLSGAEIDYKEDVRGAQFVIRNPNAKTKCGCGSSFAV